MKKTLILLLSIASFISYAQEKTVSKNFANIKSIRINTGSANISIKKSSGADVKVEVKYTYDDASYKPIIEESAGRLTLKEDFARGNNSGSSSWNLEVPDKMKLDINTGSGDIQIDKLDVNVKSNVGSGNITLNTLKGELNLNTGSGDIDMQNVAGEVALNTGSGKINAEGGSGSFSFNAGSGSIKVSQLKGDFDVNVGSGKIMANSISLTGSSKFNTGSGNATVVLANSPDHDISVNSGSGDATLDFAGHDIAGNVIMTANKKNGTIVAPFKFDKEETVDDGNSSARIVKSAKLGNKDVTIKIGTGSGTAKIVK